MCSRSVFLFCLACMQLPLVVLALTSSYTFDLLHV